MKKEIETFEEFVSRWIYENDNSGDPRGPSDLNMNNLKESYEYYKKHLPKKTNKRGDR